MPTLASVLFYTVVRIYSQRHWLFVSSSVSWGRCEQPPPLDTVTPPTWWRGNSHHSGTWQNVFPHAPVLTNTSTRVEEWNLSLRYLFKEECTVIKHIHSFYNHADSHAAGASTSVIEDSRQKTQSNSALSQRSLGGCLRWTYWTWRRYSCGFLGGPFSSRLSVPAPNSMGSSLGINSSTSDFISYRLRANLYQTVSGEVLPSTGRCADLQQKTSSEDISSLFFTGGARTHKLGSHLCRRRGAMASSLCAALVAMAM